jgi:hypothetical protein
MRLVGWAAAVVVGVAVAWALLHVFISPVNPKQEAPEKHIAGPCWACHFVSGSADVVEVE